MSTKNTETTQPAAKRPGFIGRFWAEQKSLAYSARQKQFVAETVETVRRVKNLKVQPTRVETFEDAVRRQRLTKEQLATQLQRFKNVHLMLYGLAGILLVYSLYLGLNFSFYMGLGALIASLGAGVNGYLNGFRAWQIENRNLIKLQDALRVPSTYLVL